MLCWVKPADGQVSNESPFCNFAGLIAKQKTLYLATLCSFLKGILEEGDDLSCVPCLSHICFNLHLYLDEKLPSACEKEQNKLYQHFILKFHQHPISEHLPKTSTRALLVIFFLCDKFANVLTLLILISFYCLLQKFEQIKDKNVNDSIFNLSTYEIKISECLTNHIVIQYDLHLLKVEFDALAAHALCD